MVEQFWAYQWVWLWDHNLPPFFPPSWSPTVPLFKNPETGLFLGFRVYGENAMPKANKKQNNKNQINKVCLLLASCIMLLQSATEWIKCLSPELRFIEINLPALQISPVRSESCGKRERDRQTDRQTETERDSEELFLMNSGCQLFFSQDWLLSSTCYLAPKGFMHVFTFGYNSISSIAARVPITRIHQNIMSACFQRWGIE